MLKIGTFSTIFSKYLNCTASLSACMPPWSIGNALIVKCHVVSMLSVISPKDSIFCIGLYGGNAWARFLLFIFMWLNVLAVQKY